MNKSFRQSGVSAAFAVLLFILQSMTADCSVRAAELPDGMLRHRLQQALNREGYIGSFPNGQELQRGVSAYLWDNRNWLQSVDFHSTRQLDVTACLLHKKGYLGFSAQLKGANGGNWCDNLVRPP